MDRRITLLGVVHRDPQGEARLYSLLCRVKPQAVGLELAEPSVAARREHGEELKAKLGRSLRAAGRDDLALALERGERLPGVWGELAGALELPYELRAAQAWAGQSGAALALLDDPVAAAAAVARLTGELFEEENVRALLEEEARSPAPSPDPIAEQYALARGYLGNAQLFRYHFGAEERSSLEDRDAFVARGLEALCARFERVLYVAGWEHLIDGGLKTIGALWGERARRVLLVDALEEGEEGR